jgi:hypothetical protein
MFNSYTHNAQLKLQSYKTSFGVILSNERSFVGLKNVFGLITPSPQFWRLRIQFYKIGSRGKGSNQQSWILSS